jgi:hypothetical protein
MSAVPDAMAFSTVFLAISLIYTAECHELVTRALNLTSTEPVLHQGHAKILESV